MASAAVHFNSSPVRPKSPNVAAMASWIRLQQWTSPGTRCRLSARRRRWPMSTSPAGPCASICCPTRIRWKFCRACAGHRGFVSTILRPRSAGRKTLCPKHFRYSGSRAGSVPSGSAGKSVTGIKNSCVLHAVIHRADPSGTTNSHRRRPLTREPPRRSRQNHLPGQCALIWPKSG
jgi:hypothetical protein